MENIVNCKLCTKEFNYVPGPAGGSRQLCDECRKAVDAEEIEKLKEETIIEGNKYLVGAPKRKDQYDPSDILLNKNIPVFNSDAERFVCAVEVGRFVEKCGISGVEEGLAYFLNEIGNVHRVVFLKQLRGTKIKYISENKKFRSISEEILGALT